MTEHFCLSHPELALDYAEHMLSLIELLLRRAQPEAEGVDWSAEETALQEALANDITQAASLGFELPDRRVARVYDLSDTERDILWLAVGPHLDPELRGLIARINNSILLDYVDGALCLKLVCSNRHERLRAQTSLRPGSKLLGPGLLTLNPRDTGAANLLLHELVPAGHLVSFFGGARALTPTLASVGRWIHPAVTVDEIPLPPEVRDDLFPLLTGFLERPAPAGDWYGSGGVDFPRGVAVLLHGRTGSGRTLALKALAGTLGRDLILVNGRRLGEANRNHAVQCLAALCHEAELYGELVVIRDAVELIGAGKPLAAVLANRIANHTCALVLCTDDEPNLDPSLETVTLLRRPFASTQDRVSPTYLWQVNVPGECIIPADLDFEKATGRVNLTPAQIRKAAHMAYLLAEGQTAGDGTDVAAAASAGPILDPRILEGAARAQVDGSTVGPLAEVTDSGLTLDDVILPEKTQRQIEELLSAVRNRHMVLREWGLGTRIKRGTGICCLFDGDPGTGKTLCAEVMAHALGLTLLRVNIAGVVDKYIGETEKNLTRIFDRARPDLHLLLFDEADSLFAKRTDVSRSTDRYSNMDINVLLQLVERYEGVTILTTNLKKGMDTAFERRFAFKISFPMPEEPERERIWQHLLPGYIPTSEPVDFERLSKIELAGGEIKNAIMRAAYTAAHEDRLLDMETLADAAKKEAAAAGRLVRDYD